MRVLLVEDERALANSIRQGLMDEKEIDIPFDRESIVTVRGAGYQLLAVEAPGSPPEP